KSARPTEQDPSQLALELASGASRFWAFGRRSAVEDLDGVVGANVRVRGTPAVSLETQKGGKLNVIMYMPQEGDLIVESRAGAGSTNRLLSTVAEILALTAE